MKKSGLFLVVCCLSLMAGGAVVGPYQPDAYTLQLWHLDEAAVPALNSVAGAPNLSYMETSSGQTLLSASSFSGYGTALSIGTINGWMAPLAPVNGTGDNATMTYIGANGEFTFEAIIKIGFNPASSPFGNMEFFSGDGDAGADTDRVFQFRIIGKSTSHYYWEMEMARIGGISVKATIPETGANAIAQNSWYHVAATRDSAGTVVLYWTLLDGTRTQANQIGTAAMTTGLTGNPTDFCIGNEGRDFNGRGEGFLGTIDEVRITGVALPADQMALNAVAKPRATNPSPGHGAVDVKTTAPLSWTKSTLGDSAQYLYLVTGSEPNFVGVTPVNVTGLSQKTVTLATDKTYFWAISNTATLPNGKTAASVWKFETEKSFPVILTQPANPLRIDPRVSATGSLTIGVKSGSPVTYTWYKTTDPNNDTLADDVVKLTGADSAYAALTLNAVQENEGYYYCKAVNNTGPSYAVTSNVSKVFIMLQLAHWTLDGLVSGQYADTSGKGNHATPSGTPAFVDGVDVAKTAKAAMVGDSGGWAAVPGDFNPSSFTEQFSVSLWMKWDGPTNNYQGLVAKSDRWSAANNMWQLEVQPYNDGTVYYYNTVAFKRYGGATIALSQLPTSIWHHLVVTFDGTTATLYKNVNEEVVSGAFTLGAATGAAVRIGTSGAPEGGVAGTPAYPFHGLLDEVQVFNYALTNRDIARLYNQGKYKSFCLGEYDIQYDMNADCIVNLADLAQIFQSWLSCGSIPDCQ